MENTEITITRESLKAVMADVRKAYKALDAMLDVEGSDPCWQEIWDAVEALRHVNGDMIPAILKAKGLI